MPQHDYIIANGTGASVRSDINGVLQAIASNNSDANAPSVPYACQWWADTNENLLKLRDETNTYWIPIAAIGGANLGISNTVPTGAIFHFASATAPTGYLKCNGVIVPNGSGTVQGVTANFSALYAVLGTTYGSAGQLPDLRGQFLRSWTDGSGVDSGRTFGSAQGSQNLSHSHGASADAQGLHGHTGSTDAQGAHFHGVYSGNQDAGGSDQAIIYDDASNKGTRTDNGSPNNTQLISTEGSHAHNVSVGNNGSHAHNISIAADGGAEARPTNIAMLACIKY